MSACPSETLRFIAKSAREKPKSNKPNVKDGSATVAMLKILIPKARFGSELLKTNREILGVSLVDQLHKVAQALRKYF
jgi:hypothetical protein